VRVINFRIIIIIIFCMKMNFLVTRRISGRFFWLFVVDFGMMAIQLSYGAGGGDVCTASMVCKYGLSISKSGEWSPNLTLMWYC